MPVCLPGRWGNRELFWWFIASAWSLRFGFVKYGVWYSEGTWKVLQINDSLFLVLSQRNDLTFWFLLVCLKVEKWKHQNGGWPWFKYSEYKTSYIVVILVSKASSAFWGPNEWASFRTTSLILDFPHYGPFRFFHILFLFFQENLSSASTLNFQVSGNFPLHFCTLIKG